MTIFPKLWGYIVAFGAIIAGLAGIYFAGRGKGKASMQPKVDAAQEAAAVATDANQKMESRHETDVAVERLPSAPPGVTLGDAPRDTSAGKLSDWAD